MLHFDASKKNSQELDFRSWHYATIKKIIQQIENDDFVSDTFYVSTDENDLISDTRCTMFIIDRNFLYRKISTSIVKHIAQSIRVRNIDDSILSSFEYVILKISMKDHLADSIIEKIRRQLYIVDELKANMLMRSNILDSEKMILNYNKKLLIIDSCRSMTNSMTITLDEKIKRVVRALHIITMLAHSSIMISVRLCENSNFCHDRDLMFIFYDQTSHRFNSEENVLAYIIDVNICAIQVNNTTTKFVIISRNSRLDIVQNYEEENCYAIFANHNHLTIEISRMKKTCHLEIDALVVYVATLTTKSKHSTMIAEDLVITMRSSTKHITLTSIIVYDIMNTRDQLIAIAKSYSLLWQDIDRTIDVSEKDWMSITLKSDVNIEAAKIYLLEPEDREFVNKKFNKLHDQKRMQFSSQSTSFD